MQVECLSKTEIDQKYETLRNNYTQMDKKKEYTNEREKLLARYREISELVSTLQYEERELRITYNALQYKCGMINDKELVFNNNVIAI